MLLNKKTALTLLTGVALLSTTALGGVNAFAADNTNNPTGGSTGGSGQGTAADGQPNKPGQNSLGSIDNNGNTSHDLGSDNSTNHTVSGKSDAHIRVVNGYLVLESVPSLGFQDVAHSNDHDNTSNRVVDNDTVLRSDSFFNQDTKPTELTVLDARNADKMQNKDNGGYAVNAQLGNFTNYDNGGNQTTSDEATRGKFNLLLNGRVSSSDKDAKAEVASNVQLPSDQKTNQTVLTSDTIGGGTTSVNFNKGANGNPTSLLVPKATPAGNYAAPITWTLSPSANGKNVDVY